MIDVSLNDTQLVATDPSPCSITSATWFGPLPAEVPAAAQVEMAGDGGASEASAATPTAAATTIPKLRPRLRRIAARGLMAAISG